MDLLNEAVKRAKAQLKKMTPGERALLKEGSLLGDNRASEELAVLETHLEWEFAEDVHGVIRPVKDAGLFGVFSVSIDYSFDAAVEAMKYTAGIQTCLDCGSTNWFGRKDFPTLKDAAEWAETELHTTLTELAESLGYKVI